MPCEKGGSDAVRVSPHPPPSGDRAQAGTELKRDIKRDRCQVGIGLDAKMVPGDQRSQWGFSDGLYARHCCIEGPVQGHHAETRARQLGDPPHVGILKGETHHINRAVWMQWGSTGKRCIMIGRVEMDAG